MLADLIDRFPALGRVAEASESLLRRQQVVMTVLGDTLTFSWIQAGERQWRTETIPDDLCRDGLPIQRQALGEFCADLLLDSDLSLSAVDLDLFLPPETCHWRAISQEGSASAGPNGVAVAELRRKQLPLNWPLALDDAYLGSMPVPQSPADQMLVGVQRVMLQAWVEVVEAADLSLRRVDWILGAAWRGMVQSFDAMPADLVWLMRQSTGWRIVLLNHGKPILDRLIRDVELDSSVAPPQALQSQLELTLRSWDARQPVASSVTSVQRYWWITASLADQMQWLEWMANVVHGPMLGVPKGELGSDTPETRHPLFHLALQGGEPFDLLQERRPELGLPVATPQVPSSASLLLHGSLWGSSLLVLTFAGLAGMAWFEQHQAQQLEALKPVELEVQKTETRTRELKRRTASMRKDNKAIAQQLVAVESGSALLERLRRVTPQGVQLKNLRVQPGAIQVDGVVLDGGRSGPLERINALILELESLPVTRMDGVSLIKATRPNRRGSRSTGDTSDELSFTLNWALEPSVKPSLQELEDLGANGIAERLRRLQQEGVAL